MFSDTLLGLGDECQDIDNNFLCHDIEDKILFTAAAPLALSQWCRSHLRRVVRAPSAAPQTRSGQNREDRRGGNKWNEGNLTAENDVPHRSHMSLNPGMRVDFHSGIQTYMADFDEIPLPVEEVGGGCFFSVFAFLRVLRFLRYLVPP